MRPAHHGRIGNVGSLQEKTQIFNRLMDEFLDRLKALRGGGKE